MKALQFITLIFSLSIAFTSFAQEDDIENTTSPFSVGLNLGAHFANSNSAKIYRGSSDISPFGIQYILNRPIYRQTFDDYFQGDYDIAEFPIDPVYKTSFEIGLHLGFQINPQFSIFMDLNSTKLKYEQFFTMEIMDPNNQLPGSTFEQLPIIGEENRFIINLGTQISFYREEGLSSYFSLFGNVTGTELERNYIVINNISYEILHLDSTDPSFKVGGIGLGGGAGLGLKFNLAENILIDFYYTMLYSQVNMTEEIQPSGLHHSIGMRVIWNQKNGGEELEEDW